MRGLKSDELNLIIWKYLIECGLEHSAFTFGWETNLQKTNLKGKNIPSNALIKLTQKGIQYLEMEEKVNPLKKKKNLSKIEEDKKDEFTSPLQLLHPSLTHDNLFSKEIPPSDEEIVEIEKPIKMSDKMNIDSNYSTIHTVQDNEITVLRGHRHEVFICSWSPTDALLLASGSGDTTARLWRLPYGRCGVESAKGAISRSQILKHTLIEVPGKKKDPTTSKDVTTLDWQKSGKRLATGSYDGFARIWDPEGRKICDLGGHDGPIFSLKWSHNGKYVLTGSVDNTACVWDYESTKMVQKFKNHNAPTLDVDWKNNDIFATCSTDKTIVVSKIGKEKPLQIFTQHDDEVNAIRWDPTGRLLGSCSDDGTAKIWKAENSSYISSFTDHQKEIYTIKWSPCGSNTIFSHNNIVLATASFDTTVKLWDVHKGVAIHTLSKHVDPVYSVAFSPDGRFLASGSFDSNLLIWDVKSGKLVKTMKGAGSIFEVCWNCKGDKVAGCFSNSLQETYVVCVIDFFK